MRPQLRNTRRTGGLGDRVANPSCYSSGALGSRGRASFWAHSRLRSESGPLSPTPSFSPWVTRFEFPLTTFQMLICRWLCQTPQWNLSALRG